jgi:hypothetical protein
MFGEKADLRSATPISSVMKTDALNTNSQETTLKVNTSGY